MATPSEPLPGELHLDLMTASFTNTCSGMELPQWKEHSPRSISKLESNGQNCEGDSTSNKETVEQQKTKTGTNLGNEPRLGADNKQLDDCLEFSQMMSLIQPHEAEESAIDDTNRVNKGTFHNSRPKGKNSTEQLPPLAASSGRGRDAPRKSLNKTDSTDRAQRQSTLRSVSGRKIGESDHNKPTAEQKRRIRAERNRESAEISRLRRKKYTRDLESDVGSLRETNKTLKVQTISLLEALQKIEDNVQKSIANGEGFASDAPTGGAALKAAILALENAKQQCPMTFSDAAAYPEIPLNVPK